MAKTYIKLHYDFIEMTEALTDAERGRLVVGLLEYARRGETPEETLVGNERFLFPILRRFVDWEHASYEAMIKQNAQNGKKGGRPKKANKTQNNPTDYSEPVKSQEQEQEQEKEQEHEQEQEKGCVIPGAGAPHTPALEDVLDFCKANGLRTDPHIFWNHYQANGWKSGGHPIRNWQAKLRQWEARNASDPFSPSAQPAPANPALNYAQRDYPDDDRYYIDLDAYGEDKS